MVDNLVDVDDELATDDATAALVPDEEDAVVLLLELVEEVPTQLVSLPACTVTESV